MAHLGRDGRGVSRLVEGPGGHHHHLQCSGRSPVPRDVAVDAAGTVWVATDGGLVRIGAVGGVVTGVVQDTAGTPVSGADVLLQGTPLRAVTDTQGGFDVAHVPPGTYLLRVESPLATPGPLTLAVQEVVVTAGGQTLVRVRLGAPVPFDPQQGGQVTFPVVPGAAIEVPPGATTLPDTTRPQPDLYLTGLRSLPPGFTCVAATRRGSAQPSRAAHPTLATSLPPGAVRIRLHSPRATRTYEQGGLGRQCRRHPHDDPQWRSTLHRDVCDHWGRPQVFGAGSGGTTQRAAGECYRSRWWCGWRTSLNPRWARQAVRIPGESACSGGDANHQRPGEARVRVQAGASDRPGSGHGGARAPGTAGAVAVIGAPDR